MCSTPRGITGKIASSRPTPRAVDSACSTPRGITGKIASNLPCASPKVERAQRLAASQEKSRASSNSRRKFLVCAQRLAASQEKSLGIGAFILPASYIGAQRLAASQEKSRKGKNRLVM